MNNRHVRSLKIDYTVKNKSGVVSPPLFSRMRLQDYSQDELIRKREIISKIFRGIVSKKKRVKLQNEIDTINLILES